MAVNNRGVGFVSLWGMGGSGKTTVAKAFFADQSRDPTFQRRVFLAVGQAAKGQQLEMKQRELVGKLAKGVGKSAAEELQDTDRESLTDKIAVMCQEAGPLLLVLDDLWSAYQLQQLLAARVDQLPPGSQVLLTTRMLDVVANRNPVQQRPLSKEAAITLLAWHACGQHRLPRQLHDSTVKERAVRMCGGLPLAVKVLGGILRRAPATDAGWEVHTFADARVACGFTGLLSCLCATSSTICICGQMPQPPCLQSKYTSNTHQRRHKFHKRPLQDVFHVT